MNATAHATQNVETSPNELQVALTEDELQLIAGGTPVVNAL
jgi:hypothetical protein